MPEGIAIHAPDEEPIVPRDAHDTVAPAGKWDGPTYYGRSQLKEAPFENWVVGGYIFLAGLSGASALSSASAGASGGRAAEGTVRRGRYLSLLAPTIGSALLVWDLHSPKRFYNMLRIAKRTSPMSIGTWILMSFSGFAMASAAGQFLADRVPRFHWMRRAATMAQAPAAVTGAGLATYTASLLSATSTPLWAAAPRSLAVRFGSSSVAAGAAALSLGERSASMRRALDGIGMAALATELLATIASHKAYRETDVEEALEGTWGQVERASTLGGIVLPLVLHTASARFARRPGTLSGVASAAALAGSLLLRVSVMSAGDRSASRPDISFRFAQPKNLPERRRRRVRASAGRGVSRS